MKVRDSGMPDEEMWSGFFDPTHTLKVFRLDQGVQELVEFGCGYGTFTLAAAMTREVMKNYQNSA